MYSLGDIETYVRGYLIQVYIRSKTLADTYPKLVMLASIFVEPPTTVQLLQRW
jgi:hypothetical protein